MSSARSDKAEVERVLTELHAARVRGDLPTLRSLFADEGSFRIAGASDGKPVSIEARGVREFEPWLAMLVKAFAVSDYTRLSLLIDGERAAAHWRARIHSKITGLGVTTELVDLVTVDAGRIVAYTEFFVPR
jgi:ketosteroid isomerase-like protein